MPNFSKIPIVVCMVRNDMSADGVCVIPEPPSLAHEIERQGKNVNEFWKKHHHHYPPERLVSRIQNPDVCHAICHHSFYLPWKKFFSS